MAPTLKKLVEKLRVAAGERMRAIGRAPIVAGTLDRAGAAASRLAASIGHRLAPAWQAAYAWYSKREPREKLLLRVLGAVLGVILLYNVIYRPFTGLGAGLEDRVAARQQQLLEVRAMMRTYARLKRELATAENRTVHSQNFSLFSIIEQTLSKSVGREKIGSITPSDHAVPGGYQEFTVDLKLAGLSLGQIVDVLYGVQTLPMPVTVSNLHVRQRAQDPHSYDVDMTCMSLGRNG